MPPLTLPQQSCGWDAPATWNLDRLDWQGQLEIETQNKYNIAYENKTDRRYIFWSSGALRVLAPVSG